MNIIGLGNAGCQIAKNFENYDQYSVFCVDVENKGYSTFLPVKEQNSHHSYEKTYKKLNLSKCAGPVTLILSGAGKISGCTLRLLDEIKGKPITVIYIKSDEAPLSGDAALRERITMGILQQYARSTLFENMYIISNKCVEDVLENLSLKNYWEDINNVISSTYHMLNVFKHTEALLASAPSQGNTIRIGTFGVVNFETNKEKMFYDLTYPRIKKYFYGINEKTMDEDKELLHKIREFAQGQKDEKVNVGFSIYSTSYEQNYVYATYHASCIQEEKLD